MSPFRLSRPAIRALSLTAISVLFLSISLAWATRQQAGSRPFKSARNHFSSTVFADKGGITPDGTTITVNSLLDVANSSDGLCTLREAIIAANTNAASGVAAGECAAGNSDSDTIDLTSLAGTINLTQKLEIQAGVNINGPGAGLLTLQRDSIGGE